MQINAQVMTLLHFLTSKETPRGARTFVRKYGSTEVLSYSRKYFRKYLRKVLSTSVRVRVQCTRYMYCIRTVHVKQLTVRAQSFCNLTYTQNNLRILSISEVSLPEIDTSVSLPYFRTLLPSVSTVFPHLYSRPSITTCFGKYGISTCTAYSSPSYT